MWGLHGCADARPSPDGDGSLAFTVPWLTSLIETLAARSAWHSPRSRLAVPLPRDAQPASADSVRSITTGAFVDAAHAFDVNRPATRDRANTTHPARHNESNANLAFVTAIVTRQRVRARLALQAGTSVQSNYSGEPRPATVSGDRLAQMLQEAYVAYRVTPTHRVNAGIYFSNLGMETWVSRDDPAYTRSLVADCSPYFLSGVRATWRVSPSVTARVDVVNGWQNISENNTESRQRHDGAPTTLHALRAKGVCFDFVKAFKSRVPSHCHQPHSTYRERVGRYAVTGGASFRHSGTLFALSLNRAAF